MNYEDTELKFIGVCLSTLHEEDRYNFIKALNAQAVAGGYRLVIFNCCSDLYGHSKADNAGSAAVYRLVPYKHLAAVIIMPNIMYDKEGIEEVVTNCHKYNVPVFSIDAEMEGCISLSFSYSDIFERMCRHVIVDHGARNAYMIAGFKDNIYSEERIAAYKKVLAENDIPFDENNLGYGCFWEQPTLDLLNQWFVVEKRELPDAIICANDFMAVTTSLFLQDMGYKVPHDCIVTGFDGIRQAEFLPPNITTCKQDFDKMSKLIIRLVQKLKKGEKIDSSYTVDFKIVYSQSCGCKAIRSDRSVATIRSLLTRIRLSDERQKILTYALNTIPRLSEVEQFPPMFMEKSRFGTCVWALNKNIFDPPFFGDNYKGNTCFSDEMDIIYQCYEGVEYPPCTILKEDLLPRPDLVVKPTDPVVVCSTNFSEQVMGYCLYQPALDIDEYDKVHCLTSAIGSALGSFKGRMQIKDMNRELMAANSELHRLSQRDYMTGLFNRRGFFEKLEFDLKAAELQGTTLLFVSVDLDDLKYINDNFGHSEGDNAIVTVGRALVSCSNKGEICARFGGDEFGMAVPIGNTDPDEFFNDYMKRFIEYLENYNATSGKLYKVRASIGYYYDVIDGELDTDEMIKSADAMMYAYKQKHKKSQVR